MYRFPYNIDRQSLQPGPIGEKGGKYGKLFIAYVPPKRYLLISFPYTSTVRKESVWAYAAPQKYASANKNPNIPTHFFKQRIFILQIIFIYALNLQSHKTMLRFSGLFSASKRTPCSNSRSRSSFPLFCTSVP